MTKRRAAVFAIALAFSATTPWAAAAENAPPAANGGDRAAYVAIVRAEAAARGLPPEVAEAVAEIESGYSPSAVGGVGEIGLMQIRPETAAMLGHDGGALGLFDPATNARYAVRYLAEAWRLAGGDLCRALMKYRAGHNAEAMSQLSVDYCRRARGYLATLGSPLADGAAPTVTTSASGPARASRRYLGWKPGPHTAEDERRFWAAHEARIKALTAQVQARRRARIARLARG